MWSCYNGFHVGHPPQYVLWAMLDVLGLCHVDAPGRLALLPPSRIATTLSYRTVPYHTLPNHTVPYYRRKPRNNKSRELEEAHLWRLDTCICILPAHHIKLQRRLANLRPFRVLQALPHRRIMRKQLNRMSTMLLKAWCVNHVVDLLKSRVLATCKTENKRQDQTRLQPMQHDCGNVK